MSKPATLPTNFRFLFKKGDKVGANDALEDKYMLKEAFFDTGTLDFFRDTERPECVVLGRTGAGKTALLSELALTSGNVIELDPKNLALAYLSNNQLLKFFSDAGVNMELFYHLLWRHVFAVEIIRKKHRLTSRDDTNHFINRMTSLLSSHSGKQRAIRYLLQWGESFWQDSDYRIGEVVNTVEREVTSSIGAELGAKIPQLLEGQAKTGVQAVTKLSHEEKAEVKRVGQAVVNSVQVRELAEVMRLLKEDILKDPQNRMYITIDRLDENWVDDGLRYQLIRAMLDAIREFNYMIEPLKIVVALRVDLLDRVYRMTRVEGQQLEKYRSMRLELKWSYDELEQMLDLRFQRMLRLSGFNLDVPVKARDFFADRLFDHSDPIKGIFSRTLNRPRDVIGLVNECIEQSYGQRTITKSAASAAELLYSQNRLQFLQDEWTTDYPDLARAAQVMKGWPNNFTWAEVEGRLEDALLEFLLEEGSEEGRRTLRSLLTHPYELGDLHGAFRTMMKAFFVTGLIGLGRPDQENIPRWSFDSKQVNFEDFSQPTTTYHIQPAFWRVLSIVPKRTRR